MKMQISCPEYVGVPEKNIRAKITAVLLIFVTATGCTGPAFADYASLIMDANSGRVLHETNADLIRYPASLTKMMTLYLLFDALDEGLVTLDDLLSISSHAASQPPSKLGLRPGQTISIENAILALVTKSANDVAAAIAEHLGGSESRFAWTMTARAHEIGMSRTTFVNASGLPDPYQVTTARDMATLALALLHDYPHYYHYFSTDSFYYGGSVHANHNGLLRSYDGLDGIKTGYTCSSGFNLVASAVRDGQRFIGVVLGARSSSNRSVIMTSLLDQAFEGGGIIEVHEEDPTTRPAQVQVVGATPRERDAEAFPARAGSRMARSGLPLTRMTRALAVSRAPVKTAQASTKQRLPAVLKPASTAKAPTRLALASTSSNGKSNKLVPQAQLASSTQFPRRAREKQVIAFGGKPVAAAAALTNQPQAKTIASNSKTGATRIVKASITPERSKVRVAEGGRKRSL